MEIAKVSKVYPVLKVSSKNDSTTEQKRKGKDGKDFDKTLHSKQTGNPGECGRY